MSGVGFDPSGLLDLVRTGLAILCAGGVIKLMDDFLDLRYDIFEGVETLAVRLGEGTLPYALIGFAFAALFDPAVAVALVLASYAVGMAGELDRQLPSGLIAYQEGLIALGVGFLFLPWPTVLWAAAVVLCVQSLDDLADLAPDRQSGNPNLARRFGIVEVKMVALLALVVAAGIRPISTAAVFIAVPLIEWASVAAARPLPPTRGWVR